MPKKTPNTNKTETTPKTNKTEKSPDKKTNKKSPKSNKIYSTIDNKTYTYKQLLKIVDDLDKKYETVKDVKSIKSRKAREEKWQEKRLVDKECDKYGELLSALLAGNDLYPEPEPEPEPFEFTIPPELIGAFYDEEDDLDDLDDDLDDWDFDEDFNLIKIEKDEKTDKDLKADNNLKTDNNLETDDSDDDSDTDLAEYLDGLEDSEYEEWYEQREFERNFEGEFESYDELLTLDEVGNTEEFSYRDELDNLKDLDKLDKSEKKWWDTGKPLTPMQQAMKDYEEAPRRPIHRYKTTNSDYLPRTFTYVSLGCPKNQVDFERILAELTEPMYGEFKCVPPEDVFYGNKTASALIINTCSFIKSARDETHEEIEKAIQLKKQGKIEIIVVTGCYAQRYKKQVYEEYPEVNLIVGLDGNRSINTLLYKFFEDFTESMSYGEDFSVTAVGELKKAPLYGDRVLDTAPYAYLKIAEGCSNHCTYCAIPEIRGEYRSVPVRKIIEEAEFLAESGKSEIIVVAQDITQYGVDLYGEQRLHKVLKALCKIPKIKRIRLLYAYPERIYDKLIDVIAKEKKIVKYLDMPIQHCNDAILKAMNRKSTKAELTALIEKLRERIPGIVLRTSLIAGFPGETKTQFNELAKFVKDMKFDRLGCFAYSKEEGTPAAKLPKQVKEDAKQERADYIQDLQERIMQRKNDSRVGEKVEVIIDEFDREEQAQIDENGNYIFSENIEKNTPTVSFNLYSSRSYAESPEIDPDILVISTEPLEVGEYVKVEIKSNNDGFLTASPVKKSAKTPTKSPVKNPKKTPA